MLSSIKLLVLAQVVSLGRLRIHLCLYLISVRMTPRLQRKHPKGSVGAWLSLGG